MIGLHERAIRMIASGVAINRPTKLGSFTVNAVNADCIVYLRDGGSTGPIMWALEADNASSSPTVTFERGLSFDRNIYVEFGSKGSQSDCYISVYEK